MKYSIRLAAIIFAGISLLGLSCKQNNTKNTFPEPTEGTQVKRDGEEGENYLARQKWFEAMHRTAPGVDWREIEYRNSLEMQKNFPDYGLSRNNEVIIANGYLQGKWLERGSNNQAGSVFDIDYDVETNMIYLVSDGGSLFKADFNLQDWQVLNDRFTFTHGLLKLIKKPDGSKRLIALINKKPHFSDDLGLTWEAAASYTPQSYGNVKDAYLTNFENKQYIFILAKTDYWEKYKLYMSTDGGQTYQSILTLQTSDTRNVAMAHVEATGDIFLIEQTAVNKSRIHRFDPETETIFIATDNSGFAFGESGEGNLAGVLDNETIKLYAYNGNNELHVTGNMGQSWQFVSNIPITPWEVRLYVSAKHPDLLLIGGVEVYRSLDRGQSWNMINNWWEYYDNVPSKLHADIMQFDEFEDQEGNTFITISNHGGLSISYDKTITNTNIGMIDLNVSQYYSVRTSPKFPNLVYAGSQDQGLQRGTVQGETTISYKQVISGDYGHIVFTKNGSSMWTVYPGGWVTHYSNTLTGTYDASWEVNSDNETVWIPPIIATEDPAEDAVYFAGGNMNGGSGSHIIKLSYANGTITAEQKPYNFYAASGSEISAMAISPLNPLLWFVATNNGKLYYSTDGGTTYKLSNNTVAGSHYLYGACILPSNLDPTVVYVSGSGYSTAGVLKSTNGGKHFGGMTNGLPLTMVFAIATNEDESMIFAATEAGPYVYIYEEKKWFSLAGNVAPTQKYWTVEYLPAQKVVRYGTYGRGIWDFKIESSGVSTADTGRQINSLKVYPNPVSDRATIELGNKFDGTANASVFSMEGRLIFDKKVSVTNGKCVLDAQLLPKGNYIMKVDAGKNGTYRAKISKK
ncbi:MAG TPA: hypothetical protein DCQ58_01485 [Saprospirales bacterium]|nr:hypothetical protein [Saprospirales bacterium]